MVRIYQMDSLRKWFFRPKKDDTSLLAQFFFADEALNMIASELDSFDGRKDPERCTALVNQLRQSQDKVLTITNSIMDVLIGEERANRSFRVKFPEDVLQENLAGQLWFGAECLAAGSSIMNRESESSAMRPLAKALTKSLETVRQLLRDACLTSNTPNGPLKLNHDELVTEMLLESLKIFDRHFAEFELCYVSAMVPVKTAQEFELQELISVLFSETLQRALKMKLLTQEMIEDCDPALMFTIPRLAIISGLIVFPDGPLCIDKPVEEMSEMFRPFRVLLLRIRELLWTLDCNELYTLEKLLCDNEQEARVVLLKANEPLVQEFYANIAAKDLSTGFNNNNSKECAYSAAADPTTKVKIETAKVVASTSGVTESPSGVSPEQDSFQVISTAAATLSSILNTKEESQLESPNDSGVCTENTSLDRSPSLESNCPCAAAKICRCVAKSETRANKKLYHPSTSTGSRGRKTATKDDDTISVESTDSTSSFSSTCADDEELALAMQAAEIYNRSKLRAKFRSIEDLIHRLYVCISGVADQLQTNFASDMRNILKSVFLMNNLTESPSASASCVDTQSMEYQPSESEVTENEFSVDPNILAQEALFDSNVYFHLNPDDDADTSEQQHQQLQLQQQQIEEISNEVRDLSLPQREGSSVPTSTTIIQTRQEFPEQPPIWIPDVEAPKCMSCSSNFTVVKRRHHCRNCGKVFCARCSSNSVPLPKYGHTKPVRVCNKCFMYHLAPFTV